MLLEVVVTVTTLRRLSNTLSSVVFETGVPARVKAVKAFVKDAVCALLDQLGVSMESMRVSILVVESSSVSLRETMVDAAANAAPSPSGSSSSWTDERAISDRKARS